ncbi:MAG: glycosyltransferase family 39 protein [Candidatus Saccharibacteria bacterium]|nr:glycosyltransferase family 39 protein [Candidatus Saccharibacteria bacterium]
MFGNIFKSKRRILGMEVNDWWIVAAGLIVFAALSLVTITHSSFWFDEAFGAYMIHYNFLDIARYTATDVHPPMFYWLLKIWSMVFGNTELGLRSMSVFFGGIAIVFGYLLTNKLFNKTAARISLIFMVLAPMFIRYSQEARMYMLVAAIALAATYTLTIAMESKKKLPWVIYGILISLGMWVHYYAAIIWIAHLIWHADNVRRTAKKGEFMRKFFAKEWKTAYIVAIILYIPWIPVFIGQSLVVQIAGFWIPPVTPGTPLNFLTNTVYYRDLGDATGWLALALIVAAIFLTALAFKVYKRFGKDDKQSYRLIMTLAFIPMIILFLISVPIRSTFIDRYLITSVIGIALFIGVTLAYGYRYLRIRWRYASTILIALLMIVGIANVYYLGNYNKNTSNSNQTRQITQIAINHGQDGQPIIAATPWFFYEVVFYQTSSHPVYYLAPDRYIFGSLDMLKYSNDHRISDIDTFTKQHPIWWYVGWVGQGDLKAPYSNWQEIKSIQINDPINGKPEYKAIQYKIAK